MIIIQALLIAIAANLASGRVWSPITWPFCYPLINGTVVGLILGDPLLGLMAGATINLAYIGWISAGGTMPSNMVSQGYTGQPSPYWPRQRRSWPLRWQSPSVFWACCCGTFR